MDDQPTIEVRPRLPVDSMLINLSTGVVLRRKQIAKMVINQIIAKHPTPEPPVTFIEEKGVAEPNPSHPDYKKAVAENEAQLAAAIYDAFITLGTEFVKAPDGFMRWDHTEWLQTARVLDIDMSNPVEIYLMWVKTIAALSDEDTSAILTGVGSQMGVTEAEVAEAMDGLKS